MDIIYKSFESNILTQTSGYQSPEMNFFYRWALQLNPQSAQQPSMEYTSLCPTNIHLIPKMPQRRLGTCTLDFFRICANKIKVFAIGVFSNQIRITPCGALLINEIPVMFRFPSPVDWVNSNLSTVVLTSTGDDISLFVNLDSTHTLSYIIKHLFPQTLMSGSIPMGLVAETVSQNLVATYP